MKKERKRQFNMRIRESTMHDLKQCAKFRGVTVTELARDLLEEGIASRVKALKRHKEFLELKRKNERRGRR
jgi:hypothetical protein